MHVLIATDGHLDAAAAASSAVGLAGPDGSITVLTIVEVPRMLLKDLRQVYGEAVDVSPTHVDSEYVGRAPETPRVGQDWPGDDMFLERYVEDKTNARTRDVVAALEVAGVQAEVVGRESENAASAILEAIVELGVDVVCIGTHGLGRFQGLLGSTGTKIARLATCSVLLVR